MTSFDGLGSFHTGATHMGVRLHADTPSWHPICFSSITLAAVLALSLGCARPQSSVPDGQARATARQQLIDRIVDSSVKIVVERGGRPVMFASGIVIASRPAGSDRKAVSYVLTVAHALAGEDGAHINIVVGFCGAPAARGKFAAAVISHGKLDTADLALLRVSGIVVPPVGIPEDRRVRLGQPVLVIGFPEGQRLGLSGGIVSQLTLSELQNGIPADRPEQRIVIDAAAPRGVSGGGVFEVETGRLIGIVQGHQTVSVAMKDQTQTYTLKFPVPGSTFVIPMAQIGPFLESPEVADELRGLLPVSAPATPSLPK
jgi:S1-C subfamily serine protease